MLLIFVATLLAVVNCQCPPGTSLLFNNNQIVTCSPQNRCSCESIRPGYFCQYSTANLQYVCCGASATQCPTSSPMLSQNGQQITCSGTCTSGTCNQGICCATTPEECSGQQCLSGQVQSNGVCLNKVAIGSLCQSSEQCLGGSTCISGRCQCSSGTSPSNGQCINGTGCQLGTTSVNNQCMALAAPGTTCVSSNQCIDNSQCISGQCQCTSQQASVINGYCITYTGGPCLQTQTLINNQCVTYSIVGGPCVASAQCVGGSSCFNSVCNCNLGFTAMFGYCIASSTSNPCSANQIFVNGDCYNLVTRGGYCMFSEQCLNSGTCSNGVCTVGNQQCLSTQVQINNQCYNTVTPGQTCSFTQQCLQNSQCTNGLCQCPTGSTLQNGQCIGPCGANMVLINNQCYNSVNPGSSCTFTQQCQGNSQCMSGLCQCPSGSSLQNGQCVATSCGTNQVQINNQCYNTVNPGQSCSFTQQCLQNSQCTNGMCQCPTGSTLQNGQCIGPCGANMVLINNQCYNNVNPGSSCTFTQQCQGNSQCTSGICQCSTGSSLQNGQCVATSCGTNQVQINNQCYNTVNPGQSCSFTQQCLQNSQCTNGLCQCPTDSTLQNGQCIGPCGANMVLINNQCYNNMNPGFSCTFTQQCQSNSQCTSGICQCSTGSSLQNGQCVATSCGTNQVQINNQCYNTVNPGFSCSFTQQCLQNSQCTNGVCQCPTGSTLQNGQCVGPCGANMVLINNQCYNNVNPGLSCTFTQQCQGNSQCTSGICQCSTGFTLQNGQCVNTGGNCGTNQVFINNQCYNTVSPGQSCSFTQQCLQNSQCTNGMCQCPTGSTLQNGQCIGPCGANMVLINNQCYNNVNPGFTCTFTQQCQGNSQCTSGICQCPTGFTLQNGQCVNTGGICGTSQVLINNQCYNTVSPGQSCSFTQQCLQNSQCINGMCQCPTGSTLQNGQCIGPCGANMVLINNQCYNNVNPGFTCTFTQQCQGNSQCTSGICQCPTGFTLQNGQCVNTGGICGTSQVLINNQCYNTVSPGQSCSFTQQCLQNSQCTNGVCQCPTGSTLQNGQCVGPCGANMVLINNQCYNNVNPGFACTFTQQCQGNSQCTNGMCQCSTGFTLQNGQCVNTGGNCGTNQVFINNQCYNTVSPGQSCSFTQQCLQNSQCTNGMCQCLTGSTLQNGQCIGPCGANMVLVNGQCLSTVPLYGTCSFSQQCLSNSTCTSSRCQCPSGSSVVNGMCSGGGTTSCKSYQVLINNQCLDKVSIGQTCTNIAQCIPNSICSSTCQCSSGSSYDGTSCASNTFFCSAGLVSVNSQCLALLQLGQFCQATAQCLGFAVCTNSQCRCPTGFTAVQNTCRNNNEISPCSVNQVLVGTQCLATAKPGQSCSYTQQCTGNSTCQSNVCRCPTNMVDYGDGVCRGTSSDTGVCPTGQQPVRANGQLINCMAQSCSSGSSCVFSNAINQFVCCAQDSTQPPANALTCSTPSNKVQYQGTTPINCLYSQCPSGSYCEYNNAGSQYVCCGTTSASPSFSTCTGNYFKYSNGIPFLCTSDAVCTDSTYRYCRKSPQDSSVSVCCDRT